MYGILPRQYTARLSQLQLTTISRRAQSSARSQTRQRDRSHVFKAGQTLSLERFLLRARVLKLYRTIIRAIYQIPDRTARKDPVAHAKGEFARNRNVQESEQIRYLVSTGKAEWEGMRRYVEEMAMRSRG